MGTMAAVAAAVLAGAELVRVHDVAPARQVVDLCAAIRDTPITEQKSLIPETPTC